MVTQHPLGFQKRQDSLDGPLVELDLLRTLGDRQNDGGRWEKVYSFDRRSKPHISAALFEFFIDDFWRRWRASEKVLTLADILHGYSSPGRVLNLPEQDIIERLDSYASSASTGPFQYRPSAIQGHLVRRRADPGDLLSAVYEREATYA
jgi:hypothetical protein